MGLRHDFLCPACGLTGHVSGGEDAGFSTETATLYCETCHTLQDGVVAESTGTPERRLLEPHCQVNPHHPTRLWNQHEPCPRCGHAQLIQAPSGKITLWD